MGGEGAALHPQRLQPLAVAEGGLRAGTLGLSSPSGCQEEASPEPHPVPPPIQGARSPEAPDSRAGTSSPGVKRDSCFRESSSQA